MHNLHILGLVRLCLLYFGYGLGSEMNKGDLDRGFDTELSDDRVQMHHHLSGVVNLNLCFNENLLMFSLKMNVFARLVSQMLQRKSKWCFEENVCWVIV